MDPQKHQRIQARAATDLLGVKQTIGPESAGKPGPNSGKAGRTRVEQPRNESGVSPTLLSQRTPTKPRIGAASIPLILELHDDVLRHNLRGDMQRFRDLASDLFDGSRMRDELDDLVRRGFLVVVHYGFDDSMGRDPLRDRDPKICGTGWTVEATPKLIETFWPARFVRRPRGRP